MSADSAIATADRSRAALPWGEVWGQDEALQQLQAAASDPSQLAHAWLITGPAGSGRSTLAAAFAAALIAEPGDEAAMRQVLAGTHPDLTALRTEGVIISIKDARALVERSYFSPSLGRYRVMVMEDAEREALLRTLGITPGAAVPPAVRSQLSALEDDQKRRATRSLRDGIDRVLTDLESMFRDVLMLQFGRGDDLINRELADELAALAAAWTAPRTLVVLDAIAATRSNLEGNAAPALALESMLVTVASGRTL